MKKVILLIGLILIFGLSINAQTAKCPVMPKGFLCITQEAGNEAVQNNRELIAKDAKIVILEQGLKTKDEEIVAVQRVAADNQAKLIDQIHSTETSAAQVNGQLIECKARQTLDAVLVEYLVKNQRSKQQGLINLKLGGN